MTIEHKEYFDGNVLSIFFKNMYGSEITLLLVCKGKYTLNLADFNQSQTPIDKITAIVGHPIINGKTITIFPQLTEYYSYLEISNDQQIIIDASEFTVIQCYHR